MYLIRKTAKFRKSAKRYLRSEKSNYDLLLEVIDNISNGKKLDEKFRDHQLSGMMSDYRECHVRPDLLLVYKVQGDLLILANIGSHSELFG